MHQLEFLFYIYFEKRHRKISGLKPDIAGEDKGDPYIAGKDTRDPDIAAEDTREMKIAVEDKRRQSFQRIWDIMRQANMTQKPEIMKISKRTKPKTKMKKQSNLITRFIIKPGHKRISLKEDIPPCKRQHQK